MLIRKPDDHGTPARCAFAVMSKASAPGRTKTRLVPPLTYGEAADFNTAFILDIAENLSRAAARADIATYMAYGPAGTDGFFRQRLSDEIGLLEISDPDFGVCLLETMRALFALGHESVVVINSDSPTLPTTLLIRAADALAAAGDQAVLGPSVDGGYYLLGLKQPHPRVFADITWSTSAVFRQTLERLGEIALAPLLLPEWYDIDDVECLRALARETLHGQPFRHGGPPAFHAPYSAAALRMLLAAPYAWQRLGLDREPAAANAERMQA